MKQNKISIWLMLLLFVSCTPKWDDHYEVGHATVTDQTVWEYLQSRPEYSKYVSLAKETGADKIIENNTDVTVWVPVNDQVPDLSGMSDSLKILTVKNHITLLQYTTTDMKNGIRLMSQSGKRIGIYSDDNVAFRVNDRRIVKADMVCKNGVVQEISGWLNLQDNLKDYLEMAPEYSILRDLINQVVDSVFDEKNSTPTGEFDVMDNPIYDSVFIVVNQFYNRTPLNQEGRTYTLFLTPDWILQEKIDDFYRSLIAYRGEAPKGEDTTKLENWLRNSIPYAGSYYDFTGIKTMASARGVIWRPDYQTLGGHQEFSNGTVWQVTDLYIPRTLIWPARTESDAFALYSMNAEQPVTVTVTGLAPDDVITAKPQVTCTRNNGYSVVVSPLETANEMPYDINISWTLGKSVSGIYKQITMLPGEYLLTFSFFKTEEMTNDFEVYLNDEYVMRVNIDDCPTVGTKYTVKKVVKIGEQYAENPTQMTLKTLDGKGKAIGLSALLVELKQTANNY